MTNVSALPGCSDDAVFDVHVLDVSGPGGPGADRENDCDARHTETLAQRIPLPAVLASQLAFRLKVNADA